MFERYTEKARRVIFFARFEASQYGSPYIETEHLLLGILREARTTLHRYLGAAVSGEAIRAEIAAHTTKPAAVREKIPTDADLPLSNECKRVLAYAAEEAERLGHRHIGAEHLLLGILREKGCFAECMLRERGVDLRRIRKELSQATHEEPGLGEAPLPRSFLERFEQKATSAVIFAMYEASRAGLPAVETEHLLQGLVHEDKPTVDRLMDSDISEESLRQEIEANPPAQQRTPMTLANMPLSDEGKRAMIFAGEEAERLGQNAIGTGHILLGLVREERCFAAQMLLERGADLAGIRTRLEEAAPKA
jgi:ATP-dependent Clp protease ATP-binding subunit ClpA